ncbi:MAG: ABC transporter permease [Bacteroidetes bacterium]|nr:ABC transporter permease [Bacteroidota bacterium]
MFTNYLKTTFRFLFKNKTYSFINIFGLAVGTLCCLYILLYVQDQYSYDKHHADVDDIYRINIHATTHTGDKLNLAVTAAPVTPAMKRDFPEVKQFTRVVPFIGLDKHLLIYNKKTLWETDAFIVDSTFFDVFTYRLVRGNLNTALLNPYSVVLLKPTAEKLFGQEDPLGKTIIIDNEYGKKDYKITAVVDNIGKSHLHANLFITMNSGGVGEYMLHTTAWTSNGYIGSYIKLQPNTNIISFEKKFPAFVEKYAGEEIRKWGEHDELYLQPIASIHTATGFDNAGIGKPVNPSFLGILLLIAILIQVVACINFMNLSTARAAKRAKEVGVRKVIGAGRNDLIRQFLVESFMLSLLGVLIALPLLLIALPYLNQITQLDIDASFLANYKIWLMLIGLFLLTGLVAGSYPAFYLSAFKAIKAIKGNFTNNASGSSIRRLLVVFQFVLSIVLITGIIVIYSQLRYIKNKDLGFNKEQRIVFTFNSGDSFDGIPSFMDDLRKMPEIAEVSNASKYLSAPNFFFNGFWLQGKTQSDAKGANFVIADQYFIQANGIKLVSGRDFRADDSAKVLINETYARKLGLDPAKAVGARLTDVQSRGVEIVGVMKDFNFWSLHKDVENFLVWIRNKRDGSWPNVIAHTNTANYKSLLSKIGSVWHKDVPGVPFTYSFLDESVQKQYETDMSLSRIINSFTIMAIVISCLGLFGLAAFSAEQRSKEIGIRKVLGASVSNLTQLLSRDFLKLVLIAFLIATPIAWWAMNKWLEGFAYKVPVSWWMFAAGGLIATIIALFTVSFQAIKAAIANPVKSLKVE